MSQHQSDKQDRNKTGPDRFTIDGFTAPNSPLTQETQRGLGAPNPPLDWGNLKHLGTNMGQLLKQFTPRGLLSRALLIFMVPVVLLQATIAYIFYDRYWELVTSRLGNALAGDIAAVIELYNKGHDDGMDDAAQRELLTFAARHFSLQTTITYDATLPEIAGGSLGTFDAFHRIVGKELRLQLPYPMWIDLYADQDFGTIKIAIPDDLSEPGTSTVLTFLVPIKRLTTSTGYILLLWMIGLTAILSIIAILFLRNQIRPISQLADAAEKFGRGVDPEGFKPTGAAEVRTAARAFIRMRQRIERQINQRTAMLAGISHDLRTPLTRLRLELAMLPQDEAVEHMRTDLKDMEAMLQAYLEFAKGQAEAATEDTDIAQFVQDITDRANATGKPVIFADPSGLNGLTLPIRPVQIRRSVENLINNGCRYGSRVEVHLIKLPRYLEIRIEDDGPGIPEDRYEEALRPFTRLDGARNQDSDNIGSGLGLAIARDMARAHGGDLILNRADIGGLRAAIRLPLAPDTTNFSQAQN